MDRQSLSEADIETLIKMVRERPSIWDKSCNKDSAEKKRAWREIFERFSQNIWEMEWEDLSENDKKKIDETYRGKWKNLRDAYIKSIKAGSNSQYKYHEFLKFLIKNDYIAKQTTPPPAEAGPSNKPRIGNQTTSVEVHPTNEPRTGIQNRKSLEKLSSVTLKRSSTSVKSPVKKKKLLPSVTPNTAQAKASASPQTSITQEISPAETTDTKSVSSTTDSYQSVDDDDAFFISIRPHIKRLSDHEKFEFRIRVMRAIQDITKEPQEDDTSVSTAPNDGGTDGYFAEVKQEYTVTDDSD